MNSWTPVSMAVTVTLAVAVVVVLFLLVKTSKQKKKLEQAAAKIISMTENMLSLSGLPISRPEFGRYKLKELLSEGIGYMIYRGVNDEGERCDIKIPTLIALDDKTTMGRLEREARVLETIDNPHVVRFKAFEKIKDRGRVVPILVTEPIEGDSLSNVLKRIAVMPAEDVATVMVGVSTALAAVHRNEAVHRNVTPQSINLTADGRAILHDFGIVRSEDMQQLTQRGDLLGSGPYMSPEQMNGKELDARSDLYSLGAVTYELLTGQPPYAGTTFGELVMRKMTEEAPRVSQAANGIPSELDDLVARLMHKDPNKRPESAASLIPYLQVLEANLKHADALNKIASSRASSAES